MSVENGVPSQVDEAVELAEALFKKMNPQSEEAPDETAEETPEEEEEVEDEEEEEEEQEPELDPKELKKWRDRYLTLKGKYDAEVPRLASQVKELMEKVSQPKKEEVVVPEEDDIADFASTYGEDFVQKIRKIIDLEVANKIQPVTEKVESVEDLQYKAASESFTSYLDDKVENWKDLWEGKDKGFVKFLQTKDPMGLNTYGQYLEKFNNEWDADGMVKIFDAYNKTKTQKPDTSKERDAMIAPSRTKSTSNTPSDSSKKFWTTDEVQRFYEDDRKGKYSDEDSLKIYGEILAASNEGRIR